jgi:PhzF family phenazine biosynthesis protein
MAVTRMTHPLWIVDAFTAEPFAGNPAAVCLLDHPADAPWMQAVARELGFSETAFLHAEGDGYRLRWFTPTTEVELCGHATLASAHVLWTEGFLPPGIPATFETLSGRLGAAQSGTWIELDFPAFTAEPATAPPGLAEALGVEPVTVARCKDDYLVELADERTVRTLAPDARALARLPLRGVIVTAAADHRMAGTDIASAPTSATHGGPVHDFVSRFFAPGAGVDEDPVTGFAHGILGPYWAARWGRTTLLGYQASARGGYVRVTLWEGRAILGGQAVTVVRGDLRA